VPNCAFLTIANREGWFIDDDLAHVPLRSLGWKISDVVWDANVDWNAFDVVVIRSPWDYQHDLKKFFSVLQQIESSSATLFNSLETVRWNCNKSYLIDLQNRGIEIVPSMRVDSLSRENVGESFRHFETDEIILKPTIGANADDTYLISRETEEDELTNICTIFSKKSCLVQPFMNNIIKEGEFSLMYFNGRLSHSIIKTVGTGDFRVQEEHGGGVISLTEPESGLLAAAKRTIEVLPETPIYARVDMVRTDKHTFALMELELIEPCLYFRFGERSAMDFAKAIDNRWRY
jgi:glutathione synthase/RimK-type ligase-like ATP-grasp enzyme